jgi:hypothetical protein
MKLTIRRPKELAGKIAWLNVYINGFVCGQIAPGSQIELSVPDRESEVFVKMNWCESNRIVIDSDTELKAYTNGGLLGATFRSLFRPKTTYILKRD